MVFFGGGLLLLKEAPLAAGVCFGLLTYKLQVACLIPVALGAGDRWRTLGAMAITALDLVLLSGLVLGFKVWVIFVERLAFLLGSMKTGALSAQASMPFNKMPTVFAAVKSLRAGTIVAAAAQAVVGLADAGLVVWVWHTGAPWRLSAALLVLGTFFVTPYCTTYDTVLLVIPLACLGWEEYKKGWLPGEAVFLLPGWLAPIYLGLLHPTLLLIPIILLIFTALRRLGAAAII